MFAEKPGQIAREVALARLRPLLESDAVLKVGQNAKYDLNVLARHGIAVSPIDPANQTDFLNKVAHLNVAEQSEADYDIPRGLKLRDEIGRYWKIAQNLWQDFAARRQRADLDSHAVTVRDFLEPFCRQVLGFADLKADPRYKDNNARVSLRAELLPELRRRLATLTAAELTAIFEKAGLPFAPIVKPEELFDDPHLNATGGLADVRLSDGPKAGQTARAALFPFTMDGQRLGVRHQPPHQGENTDELLQALGLSAADIAQLRALKAVA